MANFLTFAIGTLILNLTPGPDMLYVISRSGGQGRRAGAISALGIGVGILVHIALAALRVSALLRSWPLAYTLLRYAGAVYLVYLGIGLLAERRAVCLEQRLAPAKPAAIFREAVLVNVLNPKVALFFLAFLPQFASQTGVGWQIAGLGLCFDLSGTAVNLGLAWLVGLTGNFLAAGRRREITQSASGLVLIGLGFALGLTSHP